jgi:small-conductance mechanosensitive channel
MIHGMHSFETWLVMAGYALLWGLVALWARSLLARSIAELGEPRRSAAMAVLYHSMPRLAAYVVFLAGLHYGVRFLPIAESTRTTLRHDVPLALGVIGILMAMRISFRAMDAYSAANPELKTAQGFGKVIVWAMGLAAIALLASEELGFSLTPALTALGVGSLAVALALQDTLSNFFAGLYLLMGRPVRGGDFVQLDSTHEGFVESIGWRSTYLRTLGGDVILVPNATLSKATLITFRGPNPRLGIEARVDVAANADPSAVEGLFLEEAKRAPEIPGVLADPAPYVRMSPGPVNGAIGFTLYAQSASFAEQGPAQHELRKRVLARLREAKIPLAAR